MVINPYGDRPVYHQLADLLRAKIASGELAPGALLPAESRLAQEYAVGRDSVRSAIAMLRGEGLIETQRPGGSRVRSTERSEVLLELGSSLIFRVADADDRRVLKLPIGAYVAVLTQPDGASTVYVADRHIFRPV